MHIPCILFQFFKFSPHLPFLLCIVMKVQCHYLQCFQSCSVHILFSEHILVIQDNYIDSYLAKTWLIRATLMVPICKIHLKFWLRYFLSHIQAKQLCLQWSLTEKHVRIILLSSLHKLLLPHMHFFWSQMNCEGIFSRISSSSSKLSLREKVWSSSFFNLSSIALVFDSSSFTSFDEGYGLPAVCRLLPPPGWC